MLFQRYDKDKHAAPFYELSIKSTKDLHGLAQQLKDDGVLKENIPTLMGDCLDAMWRAMIALPTMPSVTTSQIVYELEAIVGDDVNAEGETVYEAQWSGFNSTSWHTSDQISGGGGADMLVDYKVAAKLRMAVQRAIDSDTKENGQTVASIISAEFGDSITDEHGAITAEFDDFLQQVPPRLDKIPRSANYSTLAKSGKQRENQRRKKRDALIQQRDDALCQQLNKLIQFLQRMAKKKPENKPLYTLLHKYLQGILDE